MKTISVIVLTYNSQDYIKETLDSILTQELLPNYKMEIIIGDDCSKDDTRTILQTYYDRYPNIISLIFNEYNMGVIKNYFNVFSNCTGEYVMECAGDDYWLPGKVKTQVKFLDENSEFLACCGDAKILYNNSRLEKRYAKNKETDFVTLIRGNTIVTPTICFKKKAMKEYIHDIDPLNHEWIMEDYPAWLWMSKNGKIAYIDEEMAVYRINSNSISHQAVLSKQIAFEENTYCIQQFFADSDSMRKVAFDGHLLRLEEIFLSYEIPNKYREIVSQRYGIKSKLKYFCSLLPGYFFVVKFFRKSKKSCV